ncbi:FIST C-terminal domain-containing protein [bacterium]|nr:FIST C-terminal domain-containing protein [bacterium]
MLWKSVLSQQSTLEAAIHECLDKLKGFPRPIDLALVFVQSGLRQQMDLIPGRLRRQLDPKVMVGCTGGGVIGEAIEVELSPALSVTVAQLPEVELSGFYLEDDEVPNPDAPPDAWRDALGLTGWQVQPSFLLMADAFDFELDALLCGLDYAYPKSIKLGGLASDARQPGGNRLVLNHELHSRGLVGLAMGGNIKVEPVVAQGCRPVGRPMTITQGERNLIFEIDGRPPLEQLEKTVQGLDSRDRKVAQTSLFVGIGTEPAFTVESILANQPNRDGDFLIRNLIGLDPRKNALVVGSSVRKGQSLQFHLRDAEASAQDLQKMLSRFQTQGMIPKGGLLFSCLGRGEYLYRTANHDSDEFRRRFPEAALGGFFCNGEIGPVGGCSYLHGYTSCFAMIGPEE